MTQNQKLRTVRPGPRPGGVATAHHCRQSEFSGYQTEVSRDLALNTKKLNIANTQHIHTRHRKQKWKARCASKMQLKITEFAEHQTENASAINYLTQYMGGMELALIQI